MASTWMRVISIPSPYTSFRFPYVGMFPWVLIAIIKWHLERAPIYTPSTTYNTISFLPSTIFLPSFFPSFYLVVPTVTPIFMELDPMRTAGNTDTDEMSLCPSCSNSRIDGRKAEGRDPVTHLASAQDFTLGVRQGPAS